MSYRRTLAAIGLIAATLAFPAGALANTNEPIAQTGGMEATLPLLGTSLTVAVTLDDVGKITSVAVTPVDASKITLTQQSATDSAVKFANGDGTTKVSVRAKGARLAITAKSTKLGDLLGDGTWAADVFGTSANSTVDYTIGESAGKPTVTIGDVTTPGDITATKGDPKSWAGKHGPRYWASASVTFERDGYRKVLRISVGVKKDGTAVLSITLKGRDRQRLEGTLEALAAAGDRTWSAHLCDGQAVSVTYRVTAEGAVQFVGASGGETTQKTYKHGIAVRFSGTKVGVLIALHQVKGTDTWRLSVKGSSGHCDGNGDKAGHAGWGWGRDKGDRHDNGDENRRRGWFGGNKDGDHH
jgi:hypothetical protein